MGYTVCRRLNYCEGDGWEEWHATCDYTWHRHAQIHLMFASVWAWANAHLPGDLRVLHEYKIMKW